MSSKYHKDSRPIPITRRKHTSEARLKAERVWETLERSYPNEIKEIHAMQHQDIMMHGSIQPATDAKMNSFLDQVVEDNHKYERTTKER